ncbi:MAG: ABC transporter permease [Rhodospirillaceae bacterium]|nr:ABC transporter permease [Rhodospirillaceae bacterium]
MSSTTVDTRPSWVPESPLVRASLWFLLIALGCLVFADIEITTQDPWPEMKRLGLGLITPDFTKWQQIGEALLMTIAFAVLGVALANLAGFLLAVVFHYRIVRVGCAFIRAVHELFWALIFLQVFGLTALTGVLAIAIPYTGICAKVYAEILEEADPAPMQSVPGGTSVISMFFYAKLPGVWAHFKTYSLYRLECGLRSSAVLGFIGLPTLGFYLETAYKEGLYSDLSALLIVFFIVISTVRKWMRREIIPIFLIAAFLVLPESGPMSWSNAWRFFVHDIMPTPIRIADAVSLPVLVETWHWFQTLFVNQALPGIFNTVVLTMIALAATGILTLMFFPLISPLFFRPFGRTVGHVFLVVVRSTPEYVLAFILLQLWGPSMFPAIVALSFHNAGIIGHLIGRFSEQLQLRPDSSKGFNLYLFEALPRVYRQFLAFLFYRWEVIFRETAILGILGVQTLGFYVDSAFADIRFDRAMVLIVITALLNIGLDAISRHIRKKLRLQTSLDAQ